MFSNRGCCNSRQNMFGGMPMNQGMMGNQMMGSPMMEGQVIEPTITKCVEQNFYHEVPQE